MSGDVVRRFMEALQGAERTGEVGPLVELFAEDAELSRLGVAEPDRGREGASRFWRDYLGAFAHVRSTFGLIVEGEWAAALEWTSEGTLPGGRPIGYAGVSLLEFEGGRVRRFRTYYDTAAFVSPSTPAP
jgi:ketosteroid isomerase-like protein